MDHCINIKAGGQIACEFFATKSFLQRTPLHHHITTSPLSFTYYSTHKQPRIWRHSACLLSNYYHGSDAYCGYAVYVQQLRCRWRTGERRAVSLASWWLSRKRSAGLERLQSWAMELLQNISSPSRFKAVGDVTNIIPCCPWRQEGG